MSLESNKFTVRNYFAALDRGGFPGVASFVTADFQAQISGGYPSMDALAYQSFYEGLYCALPNLKHKIIELLAEDERVVARLVAEGQHSGTLDGLRPCGKVVQVPILMILQLSTGKISKVYLQFDQLYLLQQIGALPSTQPQAV